MTGARASAGAAGSDGGPLAAALRWVEANLESFHPIAGGLFDPRRARPLGELAIMLHTLSAKGQGPAAPGQRIGGFLADVRSSEAFRQLPHHPEHFTLCCHVDAAARLFGHNDADFCAVLRSVRAGGTVLDASTVIEQRMDLEMALLRAGLPGAGTSWSGLRAGSVLDHLPAAVDMDDAQTYQLTHAILFSTGFGSGAPVLPPGDVPPRLRSLLEALLVSRAQDGHWDLVAELLLCWACLGWGANTATRAAWRALDAAQESDGSVPLTNAERGSDIAAPARFASHYHATLASVMAWIVAASIGDHEGEHGGGLPGPGGPARPASQQPGSDDVVERAAAWAAGEVFRARHDIERLLWLVVSRLCKGAAAEEAEVLDVALAEHGARQVPAGAALMAAVLLRRHGLRAPRLDLVVDDCAEVLDAVPDTRGSPVLDEKRMLLWRLDRRPAPAPVGSVAELVREVRLPASLESVNTVARQVASLTLWGTRMAPPGPAGPGAATLLEGFAVHTLRAGRLVLAARIVRSLAYLDPHHAGIGPVRRALAAHQRADGSFGDARTTAECVLALVETGQVGAVTGLPVPASRSSNATARS